MEERIDVPRAKGPGEAAADDQARRLLESAGLTDLRAALASSHPIMQGAAARIAGADGRRDLLEDLATLAADPVAEETARVAAAFGLARLGDERGRERLVELLAVPTAFSPAALQAAGKLARIGDPRGFDLIAEALRSGNRLDAMVAVKELDAFLDQQASVDVWGLYETALSHADPSVRGEARAQLEQFGDSRGAELLESFQQDEQ